MRSKRHSKLSPQRPAETEYTSFDILGRVTGHKQTTDGNEYTTGYTYNLSGALIEQTYPSGRVVKNTLDADGSLGLVQSKKTPSDFLRPYASNFLYNAAGAVTAMRLGNGRWENTEFNSRLQPTKIGLGSGVSSQSLLKLEYSYGTTANNGNVVEQKITVPGVAHPYIQAYTYDELNRLATAEETKNSSQEWKQTFVYDRYGNRNFATISGATTTLPSGFDPDIYNPTISTTNNRFSSGQGYSYDASGNTTRDAENRKFTYDAENKQVKVETVDGSGNPTATIGEYFYDGDGKRIKKYVPSTGETTVFVYDAMGRLIQEHATVVQTGSNAKTVYTTNDHLGSPRINTDGIGTVISRHDYHPFGEEIARTGYGSDTIRKQFTSYERDIESDLDYAINRYYNGIHGRFSSVDPYNIIFEMEQGRDEKEKQQIFIAYISQPQIWNKYVYAGNNPLSFTDPDGRQPKTINVFVGANNEDGMADWEKFKAEAKKQGITVNIYRVEDGTATAAKFKESLKAKDTVTIFSGHSEYTTHNGQKKYHYAIQLNGSTVGSSSEGLATDTADGVDIKNDIVAVFSCDFGKAFDRVTSSNGAVFVSIKQGNDPGSGLDSVNSAALSFAKSIGQRNGGVLTSTDNLSKAIASAQAGFNSFSSPQNAGDRVVSRKLFPAGMRR